MVFFPRIIDRIRLSFIPIKAVSFYLIVKIFMVILVLILENKVFVTNNVVIFFGPKIITAKRGSLNIYIIL